MKFLKLLFRAAFCTILLSGCTQGEIPKYDLNIISPAFEKAYDHYEPTENETIKYELLSADKYAEVITEENIKLIKSITVADDSISDETVNELIEICRKQNIPIFFFMKDVNNEILADYDKAYCITANYTYIGEVFAEKINDMWENEIIDKNSDKIFSFSVIKTETLSPVYQAYYDRLLEYIELLGIPLSQLDEIFLTKGDVLSYCTENQKLNEAFFILQSDYISAVANDYEPAGDGVEILGIYFGVENKYADKDYMQLCFIDYTEFFRARDAIMENIENNIYPFKNLDYGIIEKTIYIEPVI